jgi:hypothetical protein
MLIMLHPLDQPFAPILACSLHLPETAIEPRLKLTKSAEDVKRRARNGETAGHFRTDLH